MQQHNKQQDQGAGGWGVEVGKFCSLLEAMVMVATLLFMFLQLAHRRQGGELDYTKGGVAMMVNTMHQHKCANNKTKRGLGRSCSPPTVIAMVYVFFFMFLQLAYKDNGGARLHQNETCNNGQHNATTQTCNNKIKRGVGGSCSLLEVMAMVDTFLLVLLQLAQDNAQGEGN
jgi:hypothetical protein